MNKKKKRWTGFKRGTKINIGYITVLTYRGNGDELIKRRHGPFWLELECVDDPIPFMRDERLHEWCLYYYENQRTRRGRTRKVKRTCGHFNLSIIDGERKFKYPAACGTEIMDHQGIGLGKLAYFKLAEKYGGLESDPNGSTSPSAGRVWKALGARKIQRRRYRLTLEEQ